MPHKIIITKSNVLSGALVILKLLRKKLLHGSNNVIRKWLKSDGVSPQRMLESSWLAFILNPAF
jgi:hypothetical protein